MQRMLGLLAAAALAFAPTVARAEYRTCFERQLIVSVGVGSPDYGHGNDWDQAVYFNLANGKRMWLHEQWNLNSYRGRALYEMLVFAQTGRLLVSGYGFENFPAEGGCDWVSQVWMHY